MNENEKTFMKEANEMAERMGSPKPFPEKEEKTEKKKEDKGA